MLMSTVDEVRRFLNPGLTIDGILLTMYDERTNLAQQVADEVRACFGDLVFETVVPRNVRLAEAPSFGRPIHAYDLRSRGSQAYLELGREYLAPEGERSCPLNRRWAAGLKALIPDTPRARAGMAEIPVDRLRPNPQQPRYHFDEEALEELAASIRSHGVLQPLLVSEDSPGSLPAHHRRAALARRPTGRARRLCRR